MQIPAVVLTEIRIVRSCLSKGHVADQQIDIGGEFNFLQRGDLDFRFGIKSLRYLAGDTVDFHAEKSVAIPFRRIAEEVPCPAAQLRHLAGLDPKLVFCDSPHKPDQILRRVVAVQHGRGGGVIFFRRQQSFEFIVPGISLHENLGQTAPSTEAGERGLLFVCEVLQVGRLQQPDRFQVGFDPGRGRVRHPVFAVEMKILPDNRFHFFDSFPDGRLGGSEREQIHLEH